jgi:hypothetical protein
VELCLISKYCKMDIQLPSEDTPVGGSTSVALNVDAPLGAVVIVCMCRNSFTVNLEVGRSTVAGLKWYLREFLMVWEHDSRESFARSYPRDFMVVDASANLLADDIDLSCHGSVTVFELLGTTPCDLFRTITPYQVAPAIKSVHQCQWSEVAPLYCGAFDVEQEFPEPCCCFCADFTKEPRVRGMSLMSKIPDRREEIILRPITNEELKGVQYYDMTEVEAVRHDTPYGKLVNSTLFERSGAWNLYHPIVKQVSRDKTVPHPPHCRKDEVVQRRQIFYAFVLPANTNLAELGMAAIFDDQDSGNPGHFTLVPWPPLRRPDPVIDAYEILESQLFQRNPRYELPAVHPEYFMHRFDSVRYAVFPHVAAQFCCHSIWVRASAEPSEEELDANRRDFQAAKVLARAVAKLSEIAMDLTDPFRILGAVDELIMADYCLDRLDPHSRVILRTALLAACSKYGDELDDPDDGEVVQAAVEIINDALPTRLLVLFGMDSG